MVGVGARRSDGSLLGTTISPPFASAITRAATCTAIPRSRPSRSSTPPMCTPALSLTPRSRASRLDWRLGARHFLDLLVDGDIANNSGNWQWVAGTGNDTRPNRTFNPVRQALRFDPDGTYVRRWVPELASVPGPRVHTPWALDPAERDRLEYGEPLVTPARGRA